MEGDHAKISAKVSPLLPSSPHAIDATEAKALQSNFWMPSGCFLLTVIISMLLWGCGTVTASVSVEQCQSPVLLAWLCSAASTLAPVLCRIRNWAYGYETGSWKTFGFYNVTSGLVIKRILPLSVLSLLAFSLYFLALCRLCTSEVTVLYSCNKAFSYILYWTIVKEKFIGAKIVAVIFCMAGTVVISYTGRNEEASAGRALSICAAFTKAGHEVVSHLLVGKLNCQETATFLGLHGICSALLLWWVPLTEFLYQKGDEAAMVVYPVNHFCATIFLFFIYQIVEMMRSHFLPSSAESLGVFLSAAVIHGMNQQWELTSSGSIIGFSSIGVGILLLILPEDWHHGLFCMDQSNQEEANEETRSQGTLSTILQLIENEA